MGLDLRIALTLNDQGQICCMGQPIEQLPRGGSLWTRLVRALGQLPVDLDAGSSMVRAEFVAQLAREVDQFEFKYLNKAPTQRERRQERAAQRQQQREAAL